jgi:DNA anti-recombination protein RmuC
MAGELLSMIQGIKQDSDKFGRHLEVLENHIKNAGNTMGTAKKEYDKLSSSIHSAAKLELGEIEKVERLLE